MEPRLKPNRQLMWYYSLLSVYIRPTVYCSVLCTISTGTCEHRTPCPEKMDPLYFASNFAKCYSIIRILYRQT